MEEDLAPYDADALRRLVGHVPSMLAYWDRDLRCRFANRAYEAWFGVDPDRLVGTSLRDLLGPELFALNEPFILAALRGEEQAFERVVPGRDGVHRHSLANYRPDIVDGQVVGLVVSVTEVTQLKQTEASLRSAIRSLEDEIRQRRKVEDRLIDIQQSLAVTLASVDAGFIATDRQGRVTQMNAVSERLTGWGRSEALGRLLWEVFAREGREASLLSANPVDWVGQQGFTVDDVHQVVAVARDGSRTPVDVRAALTFGEDGEERGLAIVLQDRSRTLRAEIDASRLAAIVESSSDAIIGKTLDGRITSWNSAAQALFGYTAHQAIGQPVQMLIPIDRQDEETRILATLARGARVPAFDTVRLRRDGEPIDVSITISPIKDGKGRVVGSSKILRDATEKRRAEAALRDSEERLRLTLEAAQIGDWNLDLNLATIQRSARYDQCFGYAEPQAEWNFDKFIDHVHPQDRAEVEQTLHVAITTQRDWRVQCRVVWPDGSIHWISKHGSVQYKGDEATRMLGIVSDITDQRQAEAARLTAQRLEVENRQIQEANRLKSQFLANMSHELRTPLNAVIGFADLLQQGFIKPDSPKHQEFLGHIGTSGRHLLQLINDVLDLSKVESGKFEFFPELVDMTALLQEVQDTLQAAAKHKDIRISTDIDVDLVELTLDPVRLKQVLYNYLSNAIKFTAAGGRVTVRVMGQGPNHFRIEVEDTGIGISAADLPRLFTDFQQLDAGYSKQHHGSGLGLALTRRLVQAQGGHVGLRSTVGVGSVFYVVLNRTHGLDTQRAEAEALGGVDREADRVLVIKDDKLDHSLLVQALSRTGFEVDAAADSHDALRRARETPYAALTLDLRMPDKPGLELLGDIRGRGASHATPVVGVAMPAGLGNSAAFAIANVLCKPIRSDEIVAAMAGFRLGGERRASVMVIDDEQASLDLMQSTLLSLGIDAVCFQDGRVALLDIDRHRPDAIVLDLMMPAFDGFQVLDALQRLPAWRDVPVFIWTSMLLTDDEYAILARSARAILLKGGGTMDAVLESVRRRRKPVVVNTGVKP